MPTLGGLFVELIMSAQYLYLWLSKRENQKSEQNEVKNLYLTQNT